MPSLIIPDELTLPHGILLEGIVTSLDIDGESHISPMGPISDSEFSQLRLRPFQSSATYRNLRRTGEGIFHITDDVELIARSAIGTLDPTPSLVAATSVAGHILRDACRWYAFRVSAFDNSDERTEVLCDVVDQGRIRDFVGFNRAKHAVLEAAILATRCGILPDQEILTEFRRLLAPVSKTGSKAELRAFALLREYVHDKLGAAEQAVT